MEPFIFMIPFLVLISWTISDSLIKGGLKSVDSGIVSLMIVGMGLIPISIFFIIFHNTVVSFSVLALGIISGILIGSGYILFYKGLGCIVAGAILVTIQNAPAKRKYLMIAGLANIIWGHLLPAPIRVHINHTSQFNLTVPRETFRNFIHPGVCVDNLS